MKNGSTFEKRQQARKEKVRIKRKAKNLQIRKDTQAKNSAGVGSIWPTVANVERSRGPEWHAIQKKKAKTRQWREAQKKKAV